MFEFRGCLGILAYYCDGILELECENIEWINDAIRIRSFLFQIVTVIIIQVIVFNNSDAKTQYFAEIIFIWYCNQVAECMNIIWSYDNICWEIDAEYNT